MRNENFDTYLITGRWDTYTEDGITYTDFISPAPQDFMIANGQMYLSARDGDITTDGVSIDENAGDSEDWTIGHATSKSLSVNLLAEPQNLPNPPFPKNLLAGIEFGHMKTFNGYKYDETSFTVPAGANCYLDSGDHVYYGTNGNAYMDGNQINQGIGLNWVGISLWRFNSGASSYPVFYCDQGMLLWNGSSYDFVFYEDYYDFNINSFMFGKFLANGYSVWWANGLDETGFVYKWNCETGIKESWRYLPQGIFDFSNVSVYGTSYTAEVYDLMSLLDTDSWSFFRSFWHNQTTWTPQQLANKIAYYCYSNIDSWIRSYVTIDTGAQNRTQAMVLNPFSDSHYTFREALALLAGAMGCNVRLGAKGDIEFYTYGVNPIQAKYNVGGVLTDQYVILEPDTIVNETRYKSRYYVPQIDAMTYIASDGTEYNFGSGTNVYTMSSNSVVEKLTNRNTVLTNLYNSFANVPSYYASELTVVNSDPRYEVGDRIRLEDREDGSIYYALLTNIHQHWSNMNVSNLTSKGRQSRMASEGSSWSGGSGGGSGTGVSMRTSAIPYGELDSTSTSTVMTAQIDGVTSYYDGVCVWLKNGVVTSAAGFTININGLGAKPVYTNLAAATQDSTIFNINYTMLFVYDSTRVAGGCWVCYRGYDSNTNTIGYQLRTNSALRPAADTGYRYRLWFTSVDGKKWVPANTSTSTNATAVRTPNTRAIDPFGEIVYNSTNDSTTSGSNLPAATCWSQYTLSLGYSFNTTGAALTLTNPAPVYIKCTPQASGGVKMDGYVQTLPSSADGKVYIFLGMAYSATNIELFPNHPVYEYVDGAIRLYTGGHQVGERVSSDGTGISLASNTNFNELGSFTLTPGVWQLNLCVKYANNASGRRFAHLSLSNGGAQISESWSCQVTPVNGGSTWMHWGHSIAVTANTTYHICGYQNSGSPLTTTAMWDCVRIR